MNDYERIEALHSEGRITRDQADQLISALDASNAAEHEVDGIREQSTRPNGDNGPAQPASVASEIPAIHRSQAGEMWESSDNGGLDPAHKWLEVNAFTGDVDVRVNPELTEPRIKEGPIEMTERGARVAPFEAKDDGVPRNFFDRMIDGFKQADMDIEIPAGWAVSFDVKGGDVDIRGPVAAVSGHLRAGDLSITDTQAADVTVTAGEADVGLRASSGEHRVTVRVGQANIQILPGSSLEVEGSVNIGDLKVRGLDAVSRGLGHWAKGHLGNSPVAGTGKLNASVVTGDLNIRLIEND